MTCPSRSSRRSWLIPAQKSEEQAVVYQFTWNNPRPEVAIATIDLEYGDQGSRYDTPALLAITAATKGSPER